MRQRRHVGIRVRGRDHGEAASALRMVFSHWSASALAGFFCSPSLVLTLYPLAILLTSSSSAGSNTQVTVVGAAWAMRARSARRPRPVSAWLSLSSTNAPSSVERCGWSMTGSAMASLLRGSFCGVAGAYVRYVRCVAWDTPLGATSTATG
ncbi:hypothetical protein ACFQ0B_11510 [Nonomuraea thailandensis]